MLLQVYYSVLLSFINLTLIMDSWINYVRLIGELQLEKGNCMSSGLESMDKST